MAAHAGGQRAVIRRPRSRPGRAIIGRGARRRAPTARWVDAVDVVEILTCCGDHLPGNAATSTADEAVDAAQAFGFPVALKAGAPELVHKSDVGGVALGLEDEASVRTAFSTMQARVGRQAAEVIVQPMAAPGVELIVGVTHDPSFGPLVLLGMGGVTAELLHDAVLRLLPLTDVDAASMVRSLRTSPLLFGFRGAPPADVDAVEEIVLRLAQLADAVPEIAELDCNPLIVSTGGAVVADAKLRVVPNAHHGFTAR